MALLYADVPLRNCSLAHFELLDLETRWDKQEPTDRQTGNGVISGGMRAAHIRR